jgi:NADH-quinone oxidoreductase subunit E
MAAPSAPAEASDRRDDSEADRLLTVLSAYQPTKHELIPILQSVQREFGYLPEDSLRQVAVHIRVPEAHVYGVASFYAQFRFTPPGKSQVMVCRGTACHVKGAPNILEEIETRLGIQEGETSPDLEYSLETVACIGCCALAPCMMVNTEVHGRLTRAIVGKMFK